MLHSFEVQCIRCLVCFWGLQLNMLLVVMSLIKNIQVRIKTGRMEILSDLPLIVLSSLLSEGTISWKETPPTSFENTT